MGDFNLKGQGAGAHSANNATLTVTNTTGWSTKTIREGSNCVLSLSWSSIENELATGDGIMTVVVSGTPRRTITVQQGSVSLDVTNYIALGENEIVVSITDVYGNRNVLKFTITAIELLLTSSFDPSIAYTSGFSVPYTAYGNGIKQVTFTLDDDYTETVQIQESGEELAFGVAKQTHGIHTVDLVFKTLAGGAYVFSNALHYEVICDDGTSTSPIISSTFDTESVVQYSPINIEYYVYNPSSLTSDISISVNGSDYSALTVDRTKQTFNYRPTTTGTLTIAITSGATTRSFMISVTASDVDVAAVTSNLTMFLSANGRSNNETPVNRSTWTDNGISATFTNFNWVSDGWQIDDNGFSVLRVMGDNRVTIPCKIFETDTRSVGKTFEIVFSTHSIVDYSAEIVKCFAGDRGIIILPQMASLTSEQSYIYTQFKDEEKIRLSFVIEKTSENRLIYCYVNGIMTGAVQYPSDDDFTQTAPADITIGASGAGIDIYKIRVYENDLNRRQILNNWIADTNEVEDMVYRYHHNNVYDAMGRIVVSKLPNDLPYLVLTASELPQYKGDKKTVSGYFVDPADSENNFTFTGADIDVQGTSSQYYYRKNYNVLFKNGVTMENGMTVEKFSFDGNIPVNYICLKADVASSEGANNVELARLYDAACPYKTPAQVTDERIRQGVDGFPIVVFQNDSGTLTFLGKYNFNVDKGAPEFFGFASGDESWESLNNTSNRILWKSDDYSTDDWKNDFKPRYPDTDPAYSDASQLQEFAEWIKQTDRTAATNESLPQMVYYLTGTVDINGNPVRAAYSNDTADYRLAKFRNEIGNYVELQSSLFYYLFTEFFLMVDNRAKNTFPSFVGTSINS